jgi:tripartite-type tricarboxylate transporter receptor subunit TctC
MANLAACATATLAAVLLDIMLLAAGAASARAQSAEQFYKGRQLSMVVFSGAGSTYDIYARLLVRHLGAHIPGNPTFVVQNILAPAGSRSRTICTASRPRTAA